MVAPEAPPDQHREQRRDALQLEGAVKEKDDLHEGTVGSPPEPPQTRPVDFLPTFTSQRPADLPATVAAPAASSRTSDPR